MDALQAGQAPSLMNRARSIITVFSCSPALGPEQQQQFKKLNGSPAIIVAKSLLHAWEVHAVNN